MDPHKNTPLAWHTAQWDAVTTLELLELSVKGMRSIMANEMETELV